MDRKISAEGVSTQVARAVLAVAGSSDAIPAELAVALADSVLEQAQIRMAEEVRSGGEHAARRAIELATLILRSVDVPDAKEGS